MQARMTGPVICFLCLPAECPSCNIMYMVRKLYLTSHYHYYALYEKRAKKASNRRYRTAAMILL